MDWLFWLIYGMFMGAVVAWQIGFYAGYNMSRGELDKVKMIEELCESCQGYGYHINTDRMPKLTKDRCDFCDGRGRNFRCVEVERMTWSRMWRRRFRRR